MCGRMLEVLELGRWVETNNGKKDEFKCTNWVVDNCCGKVVRYLWIALRRVAGVERAPTALWIMISHFWTDMLPGMTAAALFLFFAATRGDFPESDPDFHSCKADRKEATNEHVCG